MKFLVHLAQTFICDMRVDLGCDDRGVAKHGLNRANVRAVAQEGRRVGVAQDMGRDTFRDSGVARGGFHHALNGARREVTGGVTMLEGAIVAHKEMGERVHTAVEVRLDPMF